MVREVNRLHMKAIICICVFQHCYACVYYIFILYIDIRVMWRRYL